MLDYELMVEIRREGVNVFAWEFEVRPESGGDWTTVLQGSHYAGQTVATGDGSFTADFDAVADLMGEETRGFLTIDYDGRDGVEFTADIAHYQSDENHDPIDALYWFRSDADAYGDFEYVTSEDVDGGGVVEDVAVRSRWTPELALRADASARGGDLGETTASLTQCWDASRALTYQVDDQGWFDPVGDLSGCPYADVALPEHVE